MIHIFNGLSGAYPDGQQPQGALLLDTAEICMALRSRVESSDWAQCTNSHPPRLAFAGLGNGTNPEAGLIFDQIGNLYGTTGAEIPGDCYDYTNTVRVGCGTVFELSPTANDSWKGTILYSFQDYTDGGLPAGPLLFDAAGNLYGATVAGGSGLCSLDYPYDCGVVFKTVRLQHGFQIGEVVARVAGKSALPIHRRS